MKVFQTAGNNEALVPWRDNKDWLQSSQLYTLFLKQLYIARYLTEPEGVVQEQWT